MGRYMVAAIEVDNLVVLRGGRTVLRGLGFEVAAGQVTGLLGPSGSGKTTLLRCLVGVQRLHSGTVAVLGVPAGDVSLRGRVGYVTQAPSVYADLSVRDNMRYFAALSLLTDPDDRISEVLATVGLAAKADARVGQLSGGQRARASLACALLGRPGLLVLDEPTVGQDPVLRGELWAMFRELAIAGAALIVSSHVMDEAARCDRLLLMLDGRLVADGTPEEIRTQTGASDLEEAFLRIARREQASA